MKVSPLQEARYAYQPKLPKLFQEYGPKVKCVEGEPTQSVADQETVRKLFPFTYGMPIVTFVPDANRQFPEVIKVGVVLSGGQAPGGHNVIAGIFDALKAMNPKNELYGFLGGPSGLIENRYILIDEALINSYRNTGGFDIIGSGRTKLEKEEDFAKTVANCKALGINGIVIIGGDDSNTNAALLAEYCYREKAGISVVGCPKTIDGDLKNQWIETSFGFDTATKVYSELIGNIERDANSARKYWHFIKLMGRSASHITLECALQTQPNIAIISEEIQAEKKTLLEIAREIAEVIRLRAEKGKNFGVILIPEGLIEFIPEIGQLIKELNEYMANPEFEKKQTTKEKIDYLTSKLSQASRQAFQNLPEEIQEQLLMDRDPHGNVQVSRIETEKLLIEMVTKILKEWKEKGIYKGKFSAQGHFFGYEGRCAPPSNFDADYCYGLGFNAAVLIANKKSGYISSLRNLAKSATRWVPGGIPLTMMMNIERRHGQDKPVIRKALVDLNGKPFQYFKNHRNTWAIEEAYLFPGPIQYFGPAKVCNQPTQTLILEHS